MILVLVVVWTSDRSEFGECHRRHPLCGVERELNCIRAELTFGAWELEVQGTDGVRVLSEEAVDLMK